ncbi:hypothetical protein RJ639_008371 [Escallonia herrerae]|uniref:Tubulin-specific chaperone A n=1 Tax=Escallonia herrerae TaxID=1293975 RepID=A0AA88VTA5_9ASTE|nr:hypothetical protein RJ639_008371 [Escallonia herrerae]
MATLRNLKIKTSSCKRIVKELHSYEKEIEREAAKTADMKEKGADPYDLKQQVSSLPSREYFVLLHEAYPLLRHFEVPRFSVSIPKEILLYQSDWGSFGLYPLDSWVLEMFTQVIAGHMCLVIGEIPEFVAVGFALENVLAESRMMIPDCRKRLEASLADLKGILDELEELNRKEGPEFSEAQSTIADVEMLFQKIEV